MYSEDLIYAAIVNADGIIIAHNDITRVGLALPPAIDLSALVGETAEDAELSLQKGFDAIYVSNHGGRQLDHGRRSMDVLPEVVAAELAQGEIVRRGCTAGDRHASRGGRKAGAAAIHRV